MYEIVAIHYIGADSYRYYNGVQSLKLRSMRKQLRVSAPTDITIRDGREVFIEKKVGKCWATLRKGWEVPDNQKSFQTQPSF